MMFKTRKDMNKKQLAVLDNLCLLKKQIDPAAAETILLLATAVFNLYSGEEYRD